MEDVAREPVETCRSGDHPRTPENTGTASTGRKFCRRCKYEREHDRKRKFPKPTRVKPGDVVLSKFEIERILSAMPCLVCAAVPSRRGVGEDGQPRWLDAPVTSHRDGCQVGAQREIVQRNRKIKGVAA